jgi:hypothetical protein
MALVQNARVVESLGVLSMTLPFSNLGFVQIRSKHSISDTERGAEP